MRNKCVWFSVCDWVWSHQVVAEHKDHNGSNNLKQHDDQQDSYILQREREWGRLSQLAAYSNKDWSPLEGCTHKAEPSYHHSSYGANQHQDGPGDDVVACDERVVVVHDDQVDAEGDPEQSKHLDKKQTCDEYIL